MGKRWTLRILWEMRNCGKFRYTELLEILDGISPATLSETLKDLQNQGIVKRESFGKTPPFKVEYPLTKKGLSLVIASSSLVRWIIAEKL